MTDGGVTFCWIVGGDSPWRLATWFPQITYMAFALFLVAYTGCTGQLAESARRRVLRRMMLIVFMFIGWWMLPLINRAYEAATDAASPPWLGCAAWVSKGSVGIGNAVVWAAPLIKTEFWRASASASTSSGAASTRVPLVGESGGESIQSGPQHSLHAGAAAGAAHGDSL